MVQTDKDSSGVLRLTVDPRVDRRDVVDALTCKSCYLGLSRKQGKYNSMGDLKGCEACRTFLNTQYAGGQPFELYLLTDQTPDLALQKLDRTGFEEGPSVKCFGSL